MANSLSKAGQAIRPGEGDCWKSIGVHGDHSCPELEGHVHCRNCPVHAAAAATLLDRPLPPDYRSTATQHFATAKTIAEAETQSVVIFRIGVEWLSLPTAVFQEIAALRPIHSLPHRRNGAVLGVGNVRGELLVCLSLAQMLGLDPATATTGQAASAAKAHQRLLVVRWENQRVAFPVDEVHGIHRFTPRELAPPPATLARATAAHTSAVLRWRDHSVGCLDEQRIFQTVNRSLT